MGVTCCRSSQPDPHQTNDSYRRILWTVPAINVAMFLSEVILGILTVQGVWVVSKTTYRELHGGRA